MLTESTTATANVSLAYEARPELSEGMTLGRAVGHIEHRNAAGELLHQEDVLNVIPTAGRDYLISQGYNTAAAGNGFNWVALSNDTLTETTASTTLSTEITLNGLGRAQGTYAHTPGLTTCTISKTFTASGTQSAQKAALFTASSAGTMNHALAFTQRNLISGDTLAITFTITIA